MEEQDINTIAFEVEKMNGVDDQQKKSIVSTINNGSLDPTGKYEILQFQDMPVAIATDSYFEELLNSHGVKFIPKMVNQKVVVRVQYDGYSTYEHCEVKKVIRIEEVRDLLQYVDKFNPAQYGALIFYIVTNALGIVSQKFALEGWVDGKECYLFFIHQSIGILSYALKK